MRKIFCEVLGRELRVPDVVRRIVSFSPAATETLFALGMGESVVGVSAFCVRPPEARKMIVLGSYNGVDLSRLVELKPDLIFTVTGYQRAFAFKLSGQSFPVYALELPVSLAGILDFIVKIGLVAGAYDQARKLVAELMSTLAAIPRAIGHPSVFVEIDFGEPVTFGAYSYITDAIAMLGSRNIFGAEPSEWLSPGFERVLESDPDIILYEAKMFKPFTEADLDRLIESRGWKDLRAVRNGCVFLTPGPYDFLGSPRPDLHQGGYALDC